MEKLSLIVHRISKYVLVLLLSALTLIIIAQVLSRTFLGFSIVWSEELARYLLIWSTFIGASIALRDKELVGMDLLETKLSLQWSESMKIVVHLLVLVFLGFVSYYGFDLATSKGVAGQHSPTMLFSMTYVYIAIPAGTILMMLHTLAAIGEGIRTMKGGSQV